MNENLNPERQKWNEIYASLLPENEAVETIELNQELLARVRALLPGGGAVLEAGCGAGWQSMELARSGRYQVSLMDFSENALEYARQNFQRAGLEATFFLGDATQPGERAYDLVFNAGVLEHYPLAQQVEMVRAMASRSRKYVLVLVPNRQCYWYWIWRMQKTAQQQWSFGKEVPEADLTRVFDAAGVQLVGQAYLGAQWSESFITGLDGLAEDARRSILETHRLGLVPPAQTCYLLAALGCVETGAPAQLPGWEARSSASNLPPAELHAALADAAALNVSLSRKLGMADADKDTAIAQIGSRLQDLAEKNLELARLSHESQAALAEKDARIVGLTEQRKKSDADISELQSALSQKQAALKQKTSVLEEIYRSNAWKLVQTLWKTKVQARRVRASFATQWRRVAGPRPSSQPVLAGPAAAAQTGTKVPGPSEAAPKTLPWYVKDYLLSPSENRVILIQPTFFDFHGNNMYYGGAERYLIELARLLKTLGYAPLIVQCGHDYWMRNYYDVRVIGLGVQSRTDLLTAELERINPNAALIIYSPFSYASQILKIPAIGISHGIYWDQPVFQTPLNSPPKIASKLIQNIQSVDRMVSVDTNTINWLRATKSDLAEKCVYIPNFADLETFQPVSQTGERVVVLYPRRLYRPRGFWLLADIIPDLIEKYSQVDFHFVGKADTEEEAKVQELIHNFPGRVRHYSLAPDEMHKAYQQAQIVVVPTVNSEGTSLSCLEALATANAVIASNVGGLPDLIINGYNGLLMEPNSDSLKAAIEKLLDDPQLRSELGQHGRQVVERAFDLNHWRGLWRELLRQLLPERAVSPAQPARSVCFPYTGIGWNGIKQRPHHLASEFVSQGYEVYWVDPETRGSPAPGIHLLQRGDDLYLDSPVLLIYFPYNYEEIKIFKNPRVIYDILDDISIHDDYPGEEPGKTARDYYEKMLQRADIITTSSRTLLEQTRKRRPDALYMPNGVYLDHFDPAKTTLAAEMKTVSHPVIGFHGAIAAWMDTDLLAGVIALRPGYQFVLVGPVSIAGEFQKIKDLANVRWFDGVPYEQIPAYIKGFDVGILPFKLNQLTAGVRPLKVLEYLSMKKPVVATPIEDIKDWPGVLLAGDAQKFAAQLDEALKAGGAWGDPQAVARFLEQSAWSQVVKPLMEKLAEPPPSE